MNNIYRLALVGTSLGHSISPWIHYDIMDKLGIEGTYELIEINRANFDNGFFRLLQGDYNGLNITLPYKTEAMKFMDSLSPEAERIGAINTVKIQNGITKGYNTDYHGFFSLLNKNGISLKDKNICILGTGGAAKAVVTVLKDSGVSDIAIVSRGKKEFLGISAMNYEQFSTNNDPFYCIINCTPVGMFPRTGLSPINDSTFINGEILIDLIYNPEETLLMSYAKKRGLKTVNGLDMLKFQAEKAWSIWKE